MTHDSGIGHYIMARTEVGIQKRMRQDSNIIRINFKTSKVRRMNEGEKKRFKILNKYEKKIQGSK